MLNFEHFLLILDVIYDVEIVPHFCFLLRDLLSLQKNEKFSIAYIACSIRNLNTTNCFIKTLSLFFFKLFEKKNNFNFS